MQGSQTRLFTITIGRGGRFDSIRGMPVPVGLAGRRTFGLRYGAKPVRFAFFIVYAAGPAGRFRRRMSFTTNVLTRITNEICSNDKWHKWRFLIGYQIASDDNQDALQFP